MRRGELWWADLPDPDGSGPGYRRPVLIIQADNFNQSNIQTVIALSVTSNMNRARNPGNVYLAASESGLAKDSVINVSQMQALDRNYFDQKISMLSSDLLEAVEVGIHMVLGLH